jgi:hypothetical protein
MTPPFWLRPVSDYQKPYPRKKLKQTGLHRQTLFHFENSMSTNELIGEFSVLM